jgi:hypothetical protein
MNSKDITIQPKASPKKGRLPQTTAYNFYPCLNFGGKWLQDAGFSIYERVEVTAIDGVITIRKKGGADV